MSLAVFPQAQQKQRLGRARTIALPAPTTGWNTRDALDEMAPTDALVLDNWIPRLGKVESRGGYEDYTTGIAAQIGTGSWSADQVETLIPLTSGSSMKFLACLDGGIADISSASATEILAAGTHTDATNADRWQYTIFADASAPNLPTVLAVNGADVPWTYDTSSGHAAWAFWLDGSSTTEENYIWINTFKNRVFMGTENSRDFHYGELGQIPGITAGTDDLTTFPLSGIRGAQGNILFMETMTRDTGSGPDDYAVFITDEGQAIVYAGTDPVSDWALVGVYQIPKPIKSRRAHSRLFGDVVIATELDYIFLSAAIQQAGALVLDPSKLTGAMQAASAKYRDLYGWEMQIAESESLLISNIPLETNTQYEQHVINIQTKASSRFTGWNFSTFAVYNGKLYAGGNDGVYRVLSRRVDDATTSETRIPLRAQTAWSDFGSQEIKHVRALRPLIRSQGAFTYGLDLGVDFVDPAATLLESSGPTSDPTYWGDDPVIAPTTYWGDDPVHTPETYWSGTVTASTSTSREWRLLSGRGSDFSLGIASSIKDQAIDWLSTDFKVDQAGRF